MADRIRRIFRLINNANAENVSLHILFKSTNRNNDEKWNIRKMKTAENLAQDILRLTGDFLSKLIEIETLAVIDYQPGPNLARDFIEQISITHVNDFNEIKNLVNAPPTFFQNRLEIPNFKPFAYVIKIEVDCENYGNNNSIFVFQHIQKQNSFRKGKLLNKIVDSFDSLSDEFYFLSEKFDCLYCDFEDDIIDDLNYMFIFNKQHFDWIFGFEEIFKDYIRENLQNNNQRFENIIDFNAFAEFVINDYHFVRKTYKLLTNGNFDTYFNREVLERVPQEVGILELKWDMETNMIIVNESNVKKILNIVNEDYLKSIVSDTVFLSLNKTNV